MIMREFIIPVSTGIAIFLFGMQVMRIGFEHLFLEKAKIWLRLLTNKPFLAFLMGIIVTAILQSSSAVSLITIGLTHTRVLRLREAIAIILGANIGTCITTELIAIDIYQIGVPFFVIGACFILNAPLVAKSKRPIYRWLWSIIYRHGNHAVHSAHAQTDWLDRIYVYLCFRWIGTRHSKRNYLNRRHPK